MTDKCIVHKNWSGSTRVSLSVRKAKTRKEVLKKLGQAYLKIKELFKDSDIEFIFYGEHRAEPSWSYEYIKE